MLSGLDVAVLRATDPLRRVFGCPMLVEVDGCHPTGWLRTRRGDVLLEHQLLEGEG